jgi:hypothetical protein
MIRGIRPFERPQDRRKVRNAIASAIAVITVAIVCVLIASHATAQENPESRIVLPERLHYIFDLSWCRRWGFSCIRCGKKENRIACEYMKEDCQESFRYFSCVEFNVPSACEVWSDGCNTCSRTTSPDRHSCTLVSCPNYVPAFTCKSRRWLGTDEDDLVISDVRPKRQIQL